ncbi:MAG TPA: hypothetical protein VGR27_15695 [Longimicrobiaceae bacterium]|nr:hypothetical protein [Longimicrobiaceae bacterium]
MGALRWQKLARHAEVRGYGLDVVTLDPSCLTKADYTRLHELPAGTRVFGFPEPHFRLQALEDAALALRDRVRSLAGRQAGSSDPAGEGAASSRPDSLPREEVRWLPLAPREAIRAYFAAKDYALHGSWVRRAARLGESLASRQAYTAVVSCGPPHMAHEAGRRLSVRTDLPLVMDLRDPWSLWQRLPEAIASPVWLSLARRYERRAVDRASLVVMNTLPACRAMQDRYPEAAKRIIAVMNGYDADPVPAANQGSRFTVGYAGTIYIDRDPRPLFRAAAQVIRELELDPAKFGIELMGDVHSFQELRVEDIAREEGIPEFLRVHAPRLRQEALEFLATAALLVILPQDSDLAIPSKVFEYMQFDAWILALAHPGSAIELTFRDSAIDVVAPDDLPGLTEVLRERYLQHLRGMRPSRDDGLERFSRRAQAQILFEALETRLGETSSARARRPPAPPARLSTQ